MIDARAFPTHFARHRDFRQAHIREGVSGVPLVCVHGWPETKRIYWRVVKPLVDAGFEVIAPDLRGFGDSESGPTGRYGVQAHADDIFSLVHDVLGHQQAVLLGGDLGGAVIQTLALMHPDWVDRMVLFNSPLPYLREHMSDLRDTRPPREASDYYVRQGTDGDALAADLATDGQRRRYIATFYTSRFWAHPGAFLDDGELDFHTEPFADGARLRATFAPYEEAFGAPAIGGSPALDRNERTRTLILFGTSDHVIYPAFDQMAARVFPDHVGPFLLRDCGHFVPWEAPYALTSGTAAFCSDLLAAPPRAAVLSEMSSYDS